MKQCLNLGAGHDIKAECINYDIHFQQGIDIIGDIKELPFKDNSFQKIFAFDCVEHLPLEEVPLALKEINRVLKKEGHAIIKVPNVDTIIWKYKNGAIDIIEFVRLVYGALGRRGNASYHRCGFIPSLLEHLLKRAGFEIVRTIQNPPPPNTNNIITRVKK
ncbi:MAG: methyltransferase domain-containing protein [Thermoplasmatales archaeon]|nr:methyltransferase domain-containing protein [Thermoplasmatales archaeon]